MKNIFLLIITLLAVNTLSAQKSPKQTCFPQPGSVNFTNEVVKSPTEITENIAPPQLITPPPSNPPPVKDRLVYWVHGLGGSPASWSDAAVVSESVQEAATVNDWEARKIISVRPTYSQDFAEEVPGMWDPSYGDNYHLRLAATQLRTRIDNAVSDRQPEGSDPNNNFIIAHSQGGLVSSALLYNDNFGTSFASTVAVENQNYGGLVLFSSSQGGAWLLNNRESYKAEVAKDANSIAGVLDYIAPLSSLGMNTLINQVINTYNFLENPNEDDCQISGVSLNSQYGEIIYSFLMCFTESNQDPITDGYNVGAPEIVEINTNIGNASQMRHIPKVAFYGVEPDDHLIWRNLRWAEGNPNNTSNTGYTYSPNNDDYFQANDDMRVKNLVDDIVNAFGAISNFCDSAGDANETLNPIHWVTNGLNIFYNVRDKCDEAVYTINGLDYDYKIAIGATTYTNEVQLWCDCMSRPDHVPVSNEYQISTPSECIPTIDGESCNSYDKYLRITHHFESDGTVLAESVAQTAMLTKPPFLMTNTSHMQARNNSQTKEALKMVFDGGAGLYFKTTEKN